MSCLLKMTGLGGHKSLLSVLVLPLDTPEHNVWSMQVSASSVVKEGCCSSRKGLDVSIIFSGYTAAS